MYNHGVTAEFERLKWEAEIREKQMDRYIKALLDIREILNTTETSAPLHRIHELLEKVQI